MRPFAKAVVSRTWKPVVQWYLRKPRRFTGHAVTVLVPPGVFHPGFFFSTKQLLAYLGQQELNGKSFLEIGSGSGIVSIFAAKKGASVTCCDIAQPAVSVTRQNANANSVQLEAIVSDLFEAIPQQTFDVIAVNPPYYKKDPASPAEYAWYAGKELQYFSRFFQQAKKYVTPQSQVLMVLSDECDLTGIQTIAQNKGWRWEMLQQKTTFFERGFIVGLSVGRSEMP